MPERRVVIALLVLILLGGVAVVIYGLLGGPIGQPAPESFLQPALALIHSIAAG